MKMGKPDEPDACVDHDLRVLGVKSLRVADMSILPIQPKYVTAHSFPCWPHIQQSVLTGVLAN